MPPTASYESFPLAPPPDSPSLPASSATDPSPFARLKRFLAGAGASTAPPQDAAAPTAQEQQPAPPASQAPGPAADAQRYPTARQALESALGAGAGSSSAATPPAVVPPGGAAPASRAVSRSRSRDPAAGTASPSSSSPSRTSHPHPHPHSRTRSRPPPSSPSSRPPGSSADHAPHPTAPNARFVRPLRLSGAPRPSVRVSLQQAETSGILSSSVGASSVGVGPGSAPGAGGGAGALAGDVDSPTLSEGYFAAGGGGGAGAGGLGAGSGWASGSDAPGPPFHAASSAGGSAAGGDVRKRRLSIPNLGASVPGFKRGRSVVGGGAAGGGAAGGSDEDDDARSVVSAGTGGGYRSSPTAYELMRRLRGEVRLPFSFLCARSRTRSADIHNARSQGLSKTYWIKDESARECFQCQSTFTTFRRKHHCASSPSSRPPLRSSG